METVNAEACKVFERNDKLCVTIFMSEEAEAETLLNCINKKLPKYCHLTECEVVRNSMDRKWK